jgi:hypothetical protein
MRRTASSSQQCSRPHVPENHEFVTNNNMVIFPHPPYSPDLALCDFALFPKLKIKLKGRCVLKQSLTSKGNRKRHSIALRKITSVVLLKHEKNHGIAVYVPKETIFKNMATKIEYFFT